MLEVVAAMIRNGEKFLACQRPAHKARGLQWEFPGGKVEAGESGAQALVRECKEELGVTLRVDEEPLLDLVHDYPDLSVHLTFYGAEIAEGQLQKLEHNEICWLTPQEAEHYDFCPADRAFLRRLHER